MEEIENQFSKTVVDNNVYKQDLNVKRKYSFFQ